MKKKTEYIKDVRLSLFVEDRLQEDRWWRKLDKKTYEKIMDFIYDNLTAD